MSFFHCVSGGDAFRCKMTKTKLIVSCCMIFFLFGCASHMRYSYEEIKDFSPEMQEHIRNREVVTGMTLQQVRYSWGSPTVVKMLDPTPEGKERVHWEYHRWGGALKTILGFTDGKLAEIISTEPGVVIRE
jgi:hypothetical protein